MLGQDRANAFWDQASPTLGDQFNDFGSNPRQLQLINNPNGLELMNTYGGGATVGSLNQRLCRPLD